MSASKSKPQRALQRVGEELRHADPVFATTAAVFAAVYVVITILVAGHLQPFDIDRSVEVTVQNTNVGFLDFFNAFVSLLGGFVGLGAGVVVIALTYWKRRELTPFVVVSALYSLVYNVTNFIVRRPRPAGVPHVVKHLIGYSYPSGHAGFFLWVGALFVLIIARHFIRPLYVLSWVVVLFLVTAAALSRIYVGAHWPTDVVAGLAVAIAWTAFTLSLRGLSRPLFGRAPATRGRGREE
ncbi:MAG TPA: phosphatase PAP2 family protein [Candidatus Dormibacteraeota bacterium]|nr:phosphatase PAP2 family protein [Candidatus Dormibacteraeota bacterium]